MMLEPGELLERRNLEMAQAPGSQGVVLNKDHRGARERWCIARHEMVEV